MSTVDLSESRVTLVSALAWRAIAELARRHSDQYRFRLVQFHPGISMFGVIRLNLFERHTGREAAWAEFNLGGPSGTYITDRGDGRLTLAGLLGDRPIDVIDAIENDLGLDRRDGRLPPSMPQGIALRLVAAVLERLVFDPVSWRASLAVHGWNGASHVAPWHARLLGRTLAAGDVRVLSPEDHDRLCDLVIVHTSMDGSSFDDDEDPRRRALAVDLSTSKVVLMSADANQVIGECATLYATHGRSMRHLSAAIEAELHR